MPSKSIDEEVTEPDETLRADLIQLRSNYVSVLKGARKGSNA